MSAVFDPAAIEKKIDALLSRSGQAGQRTSLLTLIAVCHRTQAKEFTGLIDMLFGKRPLRIIRLETGYDIPTAVDVSARCLPHHGGEEICFQEIVIYSGNDHQGLNPALWSPLIIRDLPVILFWRETFSALSSIVKDTELTIDKCIIDTDDCEEARRDPIGCFKRLAALFLEPDHGEDHIPLTDLAWKRLAYERQFTAALFDAEETLSALFSVTRITLRGFTPPDAVLLAFWLSSRLDYTFASQKKNLLSFKDRKKNPVVIESAENNGAHTSISFDSPSQGTFRVDFLLNDEISLTAPGRVWTERKPRPGADQFFMDEIDSISHDPLFYETLHALTPKE